MLISDISSSGLTSLIPYSYILQSVHCNFSQPRHATVTRDEQITHFTGPVINSPVKLPIGHYQLSLMSNLPK